MSITLCVDELNFVPGNTARASAAPTPLAHWNIEVSDGSKSARMKLRDPSSTLADQGLPGLGPEETIAWYLDEHIDKPFETTKSGTAAALLRNYGRNLASQIAAGNLVPNDGHLQLQIVTPRRTEKSPESLGPSLQQLHWEVLEDVSVWPDGSRLTKVSVVRSLGGVDTCTPSAGDTANPPANKAFRILLVVGRPNVEHGAEYQLVAKTLTSIVDHLSNTGQGEAMTSLHILRPPTWHAFQDHLRKAPHRYDLVHFDMKGKIQSIDGSLTAVLEFCQPDSTSPFKMRGDDRGAAEVCLELAKARVQTVVLNACDSASFRACGSGTNLAELLMSSGDTIQSVLAMAYKVSEEAVEIFTGAFYRSLLVERASIEEATYNGRLALLHNRSRRASYMRHVTLSDYVVPVLYGSKLSYHGPAAAAFAVAEPMGGIFASAGRMAASVMTRAASAVGWATRAGDSPRVPQALVGRDYDLLSLEAGLSALSMVLLHGQGGVGKTELLRYACRFWTSTSWITAAAYIDFDQQRACPHKSMEAIAKSIASQLGLGPGDSSVPGVLKKLRTGKYLVVFDSAEVFETDGFLPIDSIRGKCSKDLASQLQDFIDKATKGGSKAMVIVASRLDTTTIARVPSNQYKYPLTGLSVLASVRLVQNLAFKPGHEIPPVLLRRENIDMLRRAAILLEGNPVALRLIVPELRHANYDCEVLFDNLLHGVCTTLPRHRLSAPSRFERSMDLVWKLEPYDVSKLAAFWNLMPKDLTMFDAFWATYTVFDLAVEHWLSEELCHMISESSRAQLMRALWPDVERRLIQVGVLSHGTIGRKDEEDMPCYHIHPAFTLRSRALLSEEAWNRARFAFVRAARLWYSHDNSPAPPWTHVAWDLSGHHQHEDHLHNWRAMALAWCVRDTDFSPDSFPESGRLFDCVYLLNAGLAPVLPRLGRLLAPHLATYLLHLHARVDSLPPPGQALTDHDLSSILTYSYELWRIETDVLKSPPARRAAIIERALGVFERWKASTATRRPPRALPAELCYQQLLYAAAITAQDAGDLARAKALYATHLAASPTTTDAAVLCFIRVWQLYSLNGWASCVVRGAMRNGSLDMGMVQEGWRGVLDALARPGKKLRPGQLMGRMVEVLRAHRGVVESQTVRDQLWFALEREPDAVRIFGWLARELLDKPMLELLAEASLPSRGVGPEEGGSGVVPGPGNDGSASVRTRMDLWLEKLANMSESVRVKKRKEQRGNAPGPDARLAASLTVDAESLMRLLAGDIAGAEAASEAEMAKEELSSATSTGWERSAELHLRMYGLAVREAAEPDYKKGLTHLKEWWRLHPEGRMTPRAQYDALVDFLRCYHGLGRVEDAARAAIELVQVAGRMIPADCREGNLEATHRSLYLTIFGLGKLHIFLNPRVVVSGSPSVAGLAPVERARIHQIMKQAEERWMERERIKQVLRGVKELGELLDIMGE